jgi:hypothetical protein
MSSRLYAFLDETVNVRVLMQYAYLVRCGYVLTTVVENGEFLFDGRDGLQ